MVLKGDPMHPLAKVTLSVVGLSLATASSAYTQERDRSKIEKQYLWDLTAIYPSDDAWKQEKERLLSELAGIERFKGTLNRSSKQLLDCLELTTRLTKEYTRLYSYASMNSDQDTRVSTYLALQQEMSTIGADFGAKTAFIEPEILKMDRTTVENFLRQEKGLEIFRHYLFDILRRQAHTGTEGEEKIIADAGLMSDAAQSIYGIFSDADFPNPEVTLGDGKTVKLDKATFSLYRAAPNREDRKKVFAAFFGRIHDYRRTLGTQLYAEVKKNMFYMRARKYNSSLENALDGNNIPVEVYRKLVENTNKHLPTFHRYLNLRKRMMVLE